MKRIIIVILLMILSGITGFFMNYQDWKCPTLTEVKDNITIIPIVNEQYFNITKNEISNAKSSIDIILYEFKWYDSNNSVVQIRESLINAAKRNVSVRVLLDRANYRDQETELSKENRRTGTYLQNNGVLVKYDEWKTTTHNKLLIIDNETVILGSHNWGYSAFTKNNEASILVKDKTVAEYYKNYFEYLWNH